MVLFHVLKAGNSNSCCLVTGKISVVRWSSRREKERLKVFRFTDAGVSREYAPRVFE